MGVGRKTKKDTIKEVTLELRLGRMSTEQKCKSVKPQMETARARGGWAKSRGEGSCPESEVEQEPALGHGVPEHAPGCVMSQRRCISRKSSLAYKNTHRPAVT